jgi:hypothetical protein
MTLQVRASLFSFFLQKPLYEVYFIKKEQVGGKKSTVWKNTSTKHNKYVVKHAEDISFREPFW